MFKFVLFVGEVEEFDEDFLDDGFDAFVDCFSEDEEYEYDEEAECYCWYDAEHDVWYWLNEDTNEWLLVEEDDEDEEIYWEEDEAA